MATTDDLPSFAQWRGSIEGTLQQVRVGVEAIQGRLDTLIDRGERPLP